MRGAMYVIVVGAGAIGTQVLDLTTQTVNEVVVLEHDRERANEIGKRYDCLVLHADATVKESLEEAGAERADAIICTTESDATNIMVLLLAKELGIPNLVTVVQQPAHMSIFRQIGANALENPQRLIAEYLFRAVQRPQVQDFMHLAGPAEIFEISVTEDAPMAGRTLQEAGEQGILPEDVLVVAVERDEKVTPARGSTRIEAEDVVTVFSGRGFDPAVLKLFNTTKDR